MLVSEMPSVPLEDFMEDYREASISNDVDALRRQAIISR